MSADHTGAGKFLYIANVRSYLRKTNDTAAIDYVFEQPIKTGCFTLFYSVYRETVGELRVLGADGNGTETILKSIVGSQEHMWRQLDVSITQQIKRVSTHQHGML